jgi:hypothetical protein
VDCDGSSEITYLGVDGEGEGASVGGERLLGLGVLEIGSVCVHCDGSGEIYLQLERQGGEAVAIVRRCLAFRTRLRAVASGSARHLFICRWKNWLVIVLVAGERG